MAETIATSAIFTMSFVKICSISGSIKGEYMVAAFKNYMAIIKRVARNDLQCVKQLVLPNGEHTIKLHPFLPYIFLGTRGCGNVQCFEKEKDLSSELKAKRGKVVPFNMELSKDIQECMSNLVNDAGSESRRPFSTYAAACIMKEAELMIEWLRQGSHVPFEEYNTSNEIRQWALDLAMFEGNSNTHTAAVLLGITKEAGSLLKSASLGCLVSTDISMRIRTYGLNFLIRKLDEFESDAELTPGVSDEITSATEINQLTWGNTDSVSFGKNEEMQEQCVSKKVIDPKNITDERYSIIILRRPNVVDEEGDRPNVG